MNEMKPGIELDALIAEKVMGWTKGSTGIWHTPNGGLIHEDDFQPSLLIGHAWMVVEKAKIESLIRLEDDLWVAKIVGKYDNDEDAWPRMNEYYETSLYQESIIVGESAPYAICLAALTTISPESP